MNIAGSDVAGELISIDHPGEALAWLLHSPDPNRDRDADTGPWDVTNDDLPSVEQDGTQATRHPFAGITAIDRTTTSPGLVTGSSFEFESYHAIFQNRQIKEEPYGRGLAERSDNDAAVPMYTDTYYRGFGRQPLSHPGTG